MNKIDCVMVVGAVILLGFLDWDWTNIKSFITGGVITWLLCRRVYE